MGKFKPNILTGMFSHLNMNKKRNSYKSDHEDLRNISSKSKVKQKKKGKKVLTKGKKVLSNVSLKFDELKPKRQNENLLTPSTSKSVPGKLKNRKESLLKKSVQNIISNTRNVLTSSNRYMEMVESPEQSCNMSVKREKFKNSKSTSLRERMVKRLKAARFRYLNEQLYSTESKNAKQMFSEDPVAFKAYHEGYKQQLAMWPINPVDIIIRSLKKRAKSGELVVADFGCGEAKLAEALPCTVHSLDLVALNERVTVCDMAHSSLTTASVDVVVFCLSLMGTNLVDYLKEANRVLRDGGLMKIAEIESRFEDLNSFIHGVERMGFEAVSQDLSHSLFYFLDFKKKTNASKKKKKIIPELSLKPCLYKKR